MIFGKLFKLPQHTRFHYTPRYYKGVEEENVYKMKSKYRKDETEKNYNDFRGHWAAERKAMRNKDNYIINVRLILIVILLLLVFLYMIDFDLSIFKFKK